MVRNGLPALAPRLWRYALVLSKNEEDARDLAQATVLRALERAEQFQPGSRLDRWCFAILASIWKNELRSRSVRRGAGLVNVEDVALISNAPAIDVNILARQMLSYLNTLPDAQREAMFLVYVEGYSYQEAADRQQVPIGTVMSRLANGRAKLKQLADG